MAKSGSVNAFIHLHDDVDAGPLEVTSNHPIPVTIINTVDGHAFEGFYGKYIVTQATFVLDSLGGGVLHSVTINTPVASAVMTIYDDVSAVAANKVAVITLPGTLVSEGPMTAIYDIKLVRGLTIVTSGANGDWTVSYI